MISQSPLILSTPTIECSRVILDTSYWIHTEEAMEQSHGTGIIEHYLGLVELNMYTSELVCSLCCHFSKYGLVCM